MSLAARRIETPNDRYPSRVFSTPRCIERSDPVVYGSEHDGPLDREQLDFYERNGYLSFDQLFSADEIAPYIDELHRLRASDLVKREPVAIIEPESKALRSVFEIHKRNQLFAALCKHPRLVAIARQLLGSEVYIHQSRINYKSGFKGREFYWHSDFETWHVEDGVPAMRMVSCSISLTPNTPHNGPLMILPGSHHEYVSCVGTTPDSHYEQSLKRQEIGVPDNENLAAMVEKYGIDSPVGGIGSVTFFECNVMHGSNSNITPMPRSNIFTVYNSVENTPVAPFCGLSPRPAFLAEREDFTPVPCEN